MPKLSLKEITLFSQLSEDALETVSNILKPRQLKSGEILFNLGDPGDELIIVEKGKIAIYNPENDKPESGQPIRFFAPGEILGDMAVIDQKPRSLSARAEEDALILALKGTDFKQLLEDYPKMNLAVMSGLSDRIRYTTDFLSEVSKWVTRISQGNYEVDEYLLDGGEYSDKTLAALAAEFAQMAANVKKREEDLREEVENLRARIQVDQEKREKDRQEIMGSDFYKSLKEKAKAMREEAKR
jgi:CRP/FNR family transcriptional regulator